MLMAKTMPQPDRALRVHLGLIAGLAAATLVLGFRPAWILDAGYRCQMQLLFGLRCPFCGVTRDLAAILRGMPPSFNPCSWLVLVVVYLAYPVTFFVAWRKGRLDVFHSPALRGGVAAALAVMMVLNNLR
jgi:hypothetical protein